MATAPHQEMIRWDIFEDHFTSFIHTNAQLLFDDSIKVETQRIKEFKANLGSKIMDNKYAINNPDTYKAPNINDTIFTSKHVFVYTIKQIVFTRLNKYLEDLDPNTSSDTFYRPDYDAKKGSHMITIWKGNFVRLSDFVALFQKRGIVQEIKLGLIPEA